MMSRPCLKLSDLALADQDTYAKYTESEKYAKFAEYADWLK